MRTTIDLPDQLLQNAKKRAAERGITLSTVVEDALRGHLSQETGAAAPRFRLHTVRGKLVQPDLDLDHTSESLLSEDESEFLRPASRH